MERLFPASRSPRAILTLVAVGSVLGGYLVHEWVLEPLLGRSEYHPKADIIFLLVFTVALTLLGSWAYTRLWFQTLEGVHDVLTQAGLGVAMLDRHSRILWYNPATVGMFGLEKQSWIGRLVLEYPRSVGAGEVEIQLRKDLARLAAGQVVHGETEVPRTDGRRVAVSYALSPLRGRGGRLLGALAILMDITERKRMAEELRASRDNLQRLIEAIPAAVTVVETATGRPILWNAAAEHIAGAPVGLDLGPSERQHLLFPGERRVFDLQGHELPPADLPLQHALRTREGLSNQHLEIELEDGRRMVIVASTAFLDTPAGGQVVLIFQDISGLQRMQRELMAQHVQAEKLKAMLTTVATLNHEINNPLTGILGAADLLLDQPNLDETVRRHSSRIRDLALRISEQVGKLSVATRFEQRQEKGFEDYLKVETQE